MKIWNKISTYIRRSVTDEAIRKNMQYICVNYILAVISVIMSVVNFFTGNFQVSITTAVFAILCEINNILINKKKSLSFVMTIFAIEMVILFSFLIYTGAGDGFSILWLMLLPALAPVVCGRKTSVIVCGLVFVLLVAALWTPLNNLLMYEYSDSMRLKIPLLYVAFYTTSYFLELIREYTMDMLSEAQNEYKYLYLHDALTGIYNRYGFNQIIDEKVKHINDGGLALMILDIDFFKKVNDTYGHANGDIVLCAVAQLIQMNVEEMGDVCRWGGEEFAVLLDKSSDAENIAENIRKSVQEFTVPGDEHDINVTISIGLSIVKESMKKIDIAKLVTDTDNCLYNAKRNGRNQVISCIME
ncbi:MAG: GGDEF domain-containing protein [Oscillospiraceae bacterium]